MTLGARSLTLTAALLTTLGALVITQRAPHRTTPPRVRPGWRPSGIVATIHEAGPGRCFAECTGAYRAESQVVEVALVEHDGERITRICKYRDTLLLATMDEH